MSADSEVPLVSVVAPAFRHARYVTECLGSVALQTHPRLEIVIVDDCSDDGTADVAQAALDGPLAGRFERAVVRRLPTNRGAHAALNEGLALAHGDYVALVNTDDLYRPTRIERLLAAMTRAGSAFGFTGIALLWDDNGGAPPPGAVLLDLRQQLAAARDATIGHALLRQNVTISTGNFLFSRALGEAIGGFRPLRYCHDWDFALQALLRTQPVFLNEALYVYRLHAGNTFRETAHLALLESEVVVRRYFRAVLARAQSNPLCPSPDAEPGAFEAFLHLARYDDYWAREAGLRTRANRTLAARRVGVRRMDVAEAFRALADRLEDIHWSSQVRRRREAEVETAPDVPAGAAAVTAALRR